MSRLMAMLRGLALIGLKCLLVAALGFPMLDLRADPVRAGGESPDANADLILAEAPSPMLAGAHLQVLRDESGSLKLRDVQSPDWASRFRPAPGNVVNYGFTQTAYWYRMHLHNPGPIENWVLEIGYPMLDYIDIYLDRGAAGSSIILTGDMRHTPAGVLLAHQTIAVPVDIPGGTGVTLYLRVQTSGSHQVSPAIWTARAFHEKAERENIGSGVFYGVLLIMAIYNLGIYFWIRVRAYLYYVLYMITQLLTAITYGGHTREFANDWFEQAPAWINVSVPLFLSLMLLCGALFGREFLQTRELMPRVHRFVTVLIGVLIMCALLTPILDVITVLRVSTAAGATSLATLLIVSVVLAWRGSRPARFYMIAGAAFIVVNVTGSLMAFGLLPAWFTPLTAAQFALILDAGLLALALADRINTERIEKMRAQREVLATRERALLDSHRVERLRNFLPRQVAELVVAETAEDLLAPKRRRVTVCVIDLRGFTPFAETAEPEDVMSLLGEFYSTMGGIVEDHGGTVEHFAGDSMMIFFNAPIEMANPQLQATIAAIEMQRAFEKLCAEWSCRGYVLGMGVGIDYGYATIGAIGFLGRSQYSAIGTVSNMASRLCNLAKHGEILITEKLFLAIAPSIEVEPLGEQSIRGFNNPIMVMRVRREGRDGAKLSIAPSSLHG